MAKFHVSARRLADDLRAAFAVRDLSRLGFAAHNLKSNARTVGAQALGDLCAELERACATGAQSEVELVMRRFDAMEQAVEARLARWLLEAEHLQSTGAPA